MNPRPGTRRSRSRRLFVTGLVLGLSAIWRPLPAGAADAAPFRFTPAPVNCSHGKAYRDMLRAETEGTPAGSLRADTPPPPDGDRGYDVQRYDLDVRLLPETSSIVGTVTITLRALDAPLDRILLDLVDELTVDEIVAGATPLAFAHDGDSLVVDPGPDLAPGAELAFTVRWHGRPPRHGNYNAGLLFRRYSADTPTDPSDDRPAICSINEPWSAHAWWPCKDHPSDKALVTVAVEVPDDLVAVANGELLAESEPEPGWRRYAFAEAYPIATYLVAVYASDYVSWSEDCAVSAADPPGQPVPLEFYAFPHNEADARADLAVTCDMLEFFSGLVGPYPFAGEAYAQLEVEWGGAMENQTVTALGSFLLTGNGHWETVIIHELAHQWFGDSLTPAVWSDIWLNEGFARYSEALWVEHVQGRAAYVDFMHEIGYLAHEHLFQDHESLLAPSPVLPNILVYDKGAWVLHMLRMLLGDADFFAFLADYATDPELVLGSVTTAQMIAVAEARAGRSLAGFFTPWLTTSAVPVLRYAVTAPTGATTGAGQVDVLLRQVQAPLFEVAVPVRIYQPDGVRDELAVLDVRRRTFSWPVDGPVDSVVVDPDTLVLMDARAETRGDLQVAGPFPNPVSGSQVAFQLYLTDSSQVVVRMVDMAGRIEATWDLGLLPATGEASDPVAVPHTWRWQPLGPGQRRPAAGVYHLLFATGETTVSRKITLLH